ncbi:hypothetical protein KI387_030486, partial [Taxus chinensis]
MEMGWRCKGKERMEVVGGRREKGGMEVCWRREGKEGMEVGCRLEGKRGMKVSGGWREKEEWRWIRGVRENEEWRWVRDPRKKEEWRWVGGMREKNEWRWVGDVRENEEWSDSRPYKYAFSSFKAPYNSSAVQRAVKVEATAKLPRPETVPWQKELVNTVHLIGFIGKPVQMKITRTGKNYAWTSLGVKLSPNSENTWFQLGFWEEMAEIAAEHVKEFDQVYVSGRLNIDEVTGRDNNPRTFIQVVVSVLNFIERNTSFSPHEDVNMSSSISGSLQGDVNRKPYISGGKTPMNALETERLWQAFFVNPSEWWDNRKDK